LADAIEARGGFGEVSDGARRPALRDGVVLVAIALMIGFVAILGG
jgi:hypothetical protein